MGAVGQRAGWSGVADLRGGVILFAGLVVVYTVFQIVAGAWQSLYGEAGVAVCAVVLAALVVVERVGFGAGPVAALRRLGLGAPEPRSLAIAAVVGLALLACFPAIASATGAVPSLRAGWPWLAVGLFAQHGLAEEALFRGYLFGHLRIGRPFWRAAWVAMAPFAAVHAWSFTTLSPPVALTTIGVAVATSFPLALLFDRGGRTVWAPAAVHAAIHAIKVVEFPEAAALTATFVWLGACIVLPYLAFALAGLLRPAPAD